MRIIISFVCESTFNRWRLKTHAQNEAFVQWQSPGSKHFKMNDLLTSPLLNIFIIIRNAAAANKKTIMPSELQFFALNSKTPEFALFWERVCELQVGETTPKEYLVGLTLVHLN